MRRADKVHGAYSGAKRILWHGFIFGVLGPPIGTLASPGVIVFPIAVFFSYVTSVIPAVLAGFTIGVLSLVVRRSSTLYVLAVPIGAAFGASVVFVLSQSLSMTGLPMLYAFSGAVAALICTRLTRWTRLEAVDYQGVPPSGFM